VIYPIAVLSILLSDPRRAWSPTAAGSPWFLR